MVHYFTHGCESDRASNLLLVEGILGFCNIVLGLMPRLLIDPREQSGARSPNSWTVPHPMKLQNDYVMTLE